MALIERVVVCPHMRAPGGGALVQVLELIGPRVRVDRPGGSRWCRTSPVARSPPPPASAGRGSARCASPPEMSGPIWKMPAFSSAMAPTRRSTSDQSAMRLATGVSSGVTCVGRARAGEPHGAGADRLLHRRRHAGEIVLGRLLAQRALAHDVHAQRRMADVGAVVDRLRQAVDGGQVLREASPRSSRCRPASPRSGCPRPRSGSGRTTRASSGLQGASAKPQLPMITLVTPCQHEQLPIRSHATCASMCVWPSMKPGATIRPSASMVRSAADRMRPISDDAAIRDADVAAIARGARAVDDRPVADQQIEPHGILPRGSRAMSAAAAGCCAMVRDPAGHRQAGVFRQGVRVTAKSSRGAAAVRIVPSRRVLPRAGRLCASASRRAGTSAPAVAWRPSVTMSTSRVAALTVE